MNAGLAQVTDALVLGGGWAALFALMRRALPCQNLLSLAIGSTAISAAGLFLADPAGMARSRASFWCLAAAMGFLLVAAREMGSTLAGVHARPEVKGWFALTLAVAATLPSAWTLPSLASADSTTVLSRGAVLVAVTVIGQVLITPWVIRKQPGAPLSTGSVGWLWIGANFYLAVRAALHGSHPALWGATLCFAAAFGMAVIRSGASRAPRRLSGVEGSDDGPPGAFDDTREEAGQ